VTEISRELKELATDLQVPLVVLAQLNRGSDREDRPPRLSDLRDSGAIEQDADVVMLLHTQKPDKENAAEVEAYDSGNPLVKLMLSKNRQGPTGNVMLQFLQSQFRFVPWNPRNPSEARARNYSKEDFRASAEDWKSQSGMD
jgi:replicative DNA helicase